MSYQTEEIRRLLTETNERIDYVRKIVKHAPIGRIAQIKEHGKTFLILERRNSAGRHRYNIKSDDNRIIPILRGSFLRKELDVLLRNKYATLDTMTYLWSFNGINSFSGVSSVKSSCTINALKYFPKASYRDLASSSVSVMPFPIDSRSGAQSLISNFAAPPLYATLLISFVRSYSVNKLR